VLENEVKLSRTNDVVDATTYSFANKAIAELLNKKVDGLLQSGARFWGVLEGFDDRWLYVRGFRGQPIIIRRRTLAFLTEAI